MGPPAPTTKLIAGLLKKARAAEAAGQCARAEGRQRDRALQAGARRGPDQRRSRRRPRSHRRCAPRLDAGGDRSRRRGSRAAQSSLRSPIFRTTTPSSGCCATASRRCTRSLPLLTHAATLLKSGNAHDARPTTTRSCAYRKVLELDPENRLADAGLAQIERTYLDRALGAAAQDDFAGADSVARAGGDDPAGLARSARNARAHRRHPQAARGNRARAGAFGARFGQRRSRRAARQARADGQPRSQRPRRFRLAPAQCAALRELQAGAGHSRSLSRHLGRGAGDRRRFRPANS